MQNEVSNNLEPRIYLSPPTVSKEDIAEVVKSLESGWIAPTGPDLNAFEKSISSFVGRNHAVAMSSGTAALHLAYKASGIGSGDEVLMPTMTFAATAFPLSYLGAKPVFVDIEPGTWTIDVNLVTEYLKSSAKKNRLPKAVVAVDLYGVTCDYDGIIEATSRYEIPLIVDAAEALGATHLKKNAGAQGDASILSFNGNKIITTSGGGMFLTDSKEVADRVRYWSAQSREPTPWYEHLDVGYNYRLSNILASLGHSQLNRIKNIVEKKRAIRAQYTELLSEIEGVHVMGDPSWGESNAWLTTILLDSNLYPQGTDKLRLALEHQNIESRPTWKPMHQQPIYKNEKNLLVGVSDSIYRYGLCLPSGVSLNDNDISRVVSTIVSELRS
jgi:dTDP-4-amino-4,6-dideoxygalactose transaminase